MPAPRFPASHRAGLLFVLLAGATYYTGKELSLSGRLGLPLDDSWIHAAIARDLTGSEGASLACTAAPLWTTLESIVLRGALLFSPPGDPNGDAAVAAGKLLGLACAFAACALLWRIGRGLTGSSRLALLGALLLASQPRFLWGALAGLDTSLHAALALLGLHLHIKFRDERGARRHLPTLAFAAAGYSRPECFLFLPVAALDRAFFGGADKRRLATLLEGAAATLLAFAPYVALNLFLHGRPLPTPFYVKAEGGSVLAAVREGGAGRVLASAGTSILMQEGWTASFFPALFLPLAFAFGRGAVHLLRAPGRPASILPFGFLAFGVLHGLLGASNPMLQSGRRFFMLPPMFLATALAGLGEVRLPRAARVSAWAAAAAAGCLSLPWLLAIDPPVLLPLARYFYLGESVFVEAPLRGLSPDRAATLVLWAVIGLAFVHLAVAGAGLAAGNALRKALAVLPFLALAQNVAGLADHSSAYARNVRDTLELNVKAGTWIRDYLPTNALVAVHDYGAIAYFGRRRLLDLEGLGTPEALPARRGGAQALVDLLRERHPTHYAGSPGGLRPEYGAAFTELLRSGQIDRAPLYHETLRENSTVAGSEIVVARFTWEEGR